MPRGKYTNHKGRSRRFTSAEELEEQRRQDERNRQRRLERGDISTEESESEEKNEGSGSESEESESDDGPQKVKGVENLIEVENPNRIQKKVKKAAPAVPVATQEAPAKPELSRREREEIEKARASAQYQKLHAEGRTAQARADLARLAIVKQQREEAAKRREAERLEKEAAKASKTQQTQRALGKKT